MLAPTPLLRPSPLAIGDLFSGSFTALKNRFGLFVLIALFPSLVGLVVIGGGVALAISAAGMSGGSTRGLSTAAFIGIIVALLGGLATALAQVKAQGMMSQGAYEIAQGQRPDLRGLLARTGGFLPRMAPVIGLAIVVLLVVYGLIFGLAFAMVGALDGRSGGQAAGAAALIFVLIIVLVPLSIFVQVKLLYTIPAIALEKVGGIDGMKRSWSLTKGAFWRTLGYYLLGALVVGAISYVVSLVGQVALMPAMMNVDRSSDPRQVLATLAMLLPAYALVIGLQLAVQLVTQPFLHTYVTYMFIDQVRRAELPPQPAGFGAPGGYPPAQGYYAPPGQYYGQTGPGYPPAPQQPPQQQPPQQGPGQWPGQQPPPPQGPPTN